MTATGGDEGNEYVTAEVDYSERDWHGGQRDWRLVDVDDGVTSGRQLWYRDRPAPARGAWPWLYHSDADGATTIDEALAVNGEARA